MSEENSQIELDLHKKRKLYKRHFQGSMIRSGASLFMWLFAFAAYLLDFIQSRQLVGISLSVVFLISINPPSLWCLKLVNNKRRFEQISLLINILEIIGYTSIIYIMGGINALFLTPIYAALIAYVGVVGPPILPFKIAGLCGLAIILMAKFEYVGILPHQAPFWKEQISGSNQIIVTLVAMSLFFVVAFISSYNGKILKKNETRLKYQNTELSISRSRLKKSTEQLKKNNVTLRNTARKALEADKMKSEFLANMSH